MGRKFLGHDLEKFIYEFIFKYIYGLCWVEQVYFLFSEWIIINIGPIGIVSGCVLMILCLLLG